MGRRKKCIHGKQKEFCVDCGGSQICKHEKTLSFCKGCGGKGICEHDRQRHHCKECGGFPVLAKMLHTGARQRAEKSVLPFNITVEDVLELIGDGICPVLGTPYDLTTRRISNTSASIDRLRPIFGYTKENICVISNLANRIKTNATTKQIRRVADWMKKIGI